MTRPSSEPDQIAIVTAASSGTGAGTARAFVRAGHAVIATSRSIHPAGEPDVVAVPGAIAEAEPFSALWSRHSIPSRSPPRSGEPHTSGAPRQG
jgi:NAD(P)-dependent dehydrogenase (short-subunit alcohol dehydrogenase family)